VWPKQTTITTITITTTTATIFVCKTWTAFLSCSWSSYIFSLAGKINWYMVYIYIHTSNICTNIGTLETALSIYILANAQIANCPLPFKPTECNKGNKNNANNCNCNPFIVHCQHALIKNASTFADWLPHPVSFFDNVYYLVWATSEKWKNGKLQADNFQFTVNSRQTWRIRYCKNTEMGFVWWNNVCSNSISISTYIYAYVYVGVSVSVTLSLSLSLSLIAKRNYEFT